MCQFRPSNAPVRAARLTARSLTLLSVWNCLTVRHTAKKGNGRGDETAELPGELGRRCSHCGFEIPTDRELLWWLRAIEGFGTATDQKRPDFSAIEGAAQAR